jgi:tRNA 2-thiocytidine biosynthesis protein TtcA
MRPEAEMNEMTKSHRILNARMDKAVWEYNMFADGDNTLIAVSGGADSMALLDLLSLRLPIYAANLTLFAVYVDLGFGVHSDVRCRIMDEHFRKTGVSGKIVQTTIGPLAHSEENRENPCFLCARIRRKKIFESAEEFACRKVIFAHHKNDIIETLLLNMIFGREISTMPPRLEIFHGKYTIVRPLAFVEDELLKKYCTEREIVIIDQECPTAGNSKRQYVKELLRKLEKDHRGANENIFASMKRVKTDYLL